MPHTSIPLTSLIVYSDEGSCDIIQVLPHPDGVLSVGPAISAASEETQKYFWIYHLETGKKLPFAFRDALSACAYVWSVRHGQIADWENLTESEFAQLMGWAISQFGTGVEGGEKVQ